MRRGLMSFRQQCIYIILVERMKRFDGFECLVQSLHAVNARDNDGGRKIQRVVQTLDRRYSLRLQQDSVRHALHSEYAHLKPYQLRQNHLLKAAKMRVHNIHRHLGSIKCESVLFGDFKHIEMYMRILVAGESDVADLAGSAGFDKRGIRSLLSK